jgi:dynein heavy chain
MYDTPLSACFSQLHLHMQTPALFDKEEVRERLRRLAGGPMQPLTVHLRQEVDRLNIVIKLTTTTLQNLRLAIAGTIALSGTLIESLDALFMARIPVEWLKKSWEVGSQLDFSVAACRNM